MKKQIEFMLVLAISCFSSGYRRSRDRYFICSHKTNANDVMKVRLFMLVFLMQLPLLIIAKEDVKIETTTISEVSFLEKIKGKITDKEGAPIPSALFYSLT